MQYTIEVSNLSKRYDEFHLKDINLKIPKGKIVGLIGENGAGKTTLISLLLNQINRDSGNIQIFGLDNIADENTIKKDLGFVVDECCFHGCLTPKNINKIMKPIYKNWNESTYRELLKMLNISDSKQIREMSKGMKTKIMLAVALSHSPKLLILDEVTSGLDPVVRDDILILLKNYVSNSENTVFFSTHITSDLDRSADNVAFLHNGKLIMMEDIEDIREKYRICTCTKEEREKIDKDLIIAEIVEHNMFLILAYYNANLELTLNQKSVKQPTIDDIMLLYIKGGAAL